MSAAEATTDDPAEQLLVFARAFEDAADDAMAVKPRCLFVSFIYETELSDVGTEAIVAESILHWRQRIADHWFTTFEGAFLLAQALEDPSAMRRQLAHLRRYLELLFEPATDGR